MPNPTRYVVEPSVENNMVVFKSSLIWRMAGVCTLELKLTMPAMLTTIPVYTPTPVFQFPQDQRQGRCFQFFPHFITYISRN